MTCIEYEKRYGQSLEDELVHAHCSLKHTSVSIQCMQCITCACMYYTCRIHCIAVCMFVCVCVCRDNLLARHYPRHYCRHSRRVHFRNHHVCTCTCTCTCTCSTTCVHHSHLLTYSCQPCLVYSVHVHGLGSIPGGSQDIFSSSWPSNVYG